MNNGVNVIAALGGKIKGVRDEMADKKISNSDMAKIKNRECGNGIVIDNGNNIETQYCHLKQGSIKVKTGDEIKTGDVLGQVGFSGMTEFPHLHFEIRINGVVIDPFTGESSMNESECSNHIEEPLWNDATSRIFTYIPTGLLGAGFSDRIPDIDKARSGELPQTKKIRKDAKVITFWFDLFGIQQRDVVESILYSPDMEVAAKNQKYMDKSKAVYFGYIGKKTKGELTEGKYKAVVRVLRNKEIILEKSGTIEITASY